MKITLVITRKFRQAQAMIGGTRWSRFRFQLVSLEFFIHLILPVAHYVPGVDSASNRNEYQ